MQNSKRYRPSKTVASSRPIGHVFTRRLFLKTAAGVVLWVLLCGMKPPASTQLLDATFEVSSYHLTSPKIKEKLRIILVSDLHLWEHGTDNCDLIRRIFSLQPNLIVLVGDILNSYQQDYSVALSFVRQLVESHVAPVYYTYGNHETAYLKKYGSTFEEELLATGVCLLNNTVQTIRLGKNTLCLGGITAYHKQYKRNLSSQQAVQLLQKAEGFRLLLDHFPEYFLELFAHDLDVDLTLCGHTHGGIVRMPEGGALYVPSQGWFPPYTEGMHQCGQCTVVIGRGLGGRRDIPRINNTPELVFVDVRPCKEVVLAEQAAQQQGAFEQSAEPTTTEPTSAPTILEDDNLP